jgi:hypothetical protein
LQIRRAALNCSQPSSATTGHRHFQRFRQKLNTQHNPKSVRHKRIHQIPRIHHLLNIRNGIAFQSISSRTDFPSRTRTILPSSIPIQYRSPEECFTRMAPVPFHRAGLGLEWLSQFLV